MFSQSHKEYTQDYMPSHIAGEVVEENSLFKGHCLTKSLIRTTGHILNLSGQSTQFSLTVDFPDSNSRTSYFYSPSGLPTNHELD